MDRRFYFKKSFFIKRCVRTRGNQVPDKILNDLSQQVEDYFNSPEAIFLKNDESSSIIIINSDGWIGVVRRDNPNGFFKFVGKAFKKSSSLKIWEKAFWLNQKGLETISPLVLIQDYFLFLRLRSFVVLSFEKGITLNSYLEDPDIAQNSKMQITIQIILLIKKWHSLGVAHRDPKNLNILINGKRICLLDIEDAKAPRSDFVKRRFFAKDWAIILQSLHRYPKLKIAALEIIFNSFDSDPAVFSKRLIKKCFNSELQVVRAGFLKTIPPRVVNDIVTKKQPLPGWKAVNQRSGCVHLSAEKGTVHFLISVRNYFQIKIPNPSKGIFSMALALGICGIKLPPLIDGGFEGKSEYLIFSTRNLETLERRLKQAGNDDHLISRILDSAGCQIGRFHAMGFIHGNLSLSNIFVIQEGDAYVIVFCPDINTRWYLRKKTRRISKDLYRLKEQIHPDQFGKAASLFWQAYHKASGTDYTTTQ